MSAVLPSASGTWRPDKRRSRSGAIFSGFRAAAARHWCGGLSIALDHSGAQSHHLFPKALRKLTGPHRAVDDIDRSAVVSRRFDRGINDEPSEEWLVERVDKVGERGFVAQAMSTDPMLWTLDANLDFSAARRKLIAARIHEFLGADARTWL